MKIQNIRLKKLDTGSCHGCEFISKCNSYCARNCMMKVSCCECLDMAKQLDYPIATCPQILEPKSTTCDSWKAKKFDEGDANNGS